jgi:hypothetical protein
MKLAFPYGVGAFPLGVVGVVALAVLALVCAPVPVPVTFNR